MAIRTPDPMYLQQGQEVVGIFWNEEEYIKVGEYDCIRLHVNNLNGEMAGVPWIVAEYSSGKRFMHNAKMLTSIQLPDAPEVTDDS